MRLHGIVEKAWLLFFIYLFLYQDCRIVIPLHPMSCELWTTYLNFLSFCLLSHKVEKEHIYKDIRRIKLGDVNKALSTRPALASEFFFIFKKIKYKYKTFSDLLERVLSPNNKIQTCLFYVNKHIIKHTCHLPKYELKIELRRKKNTHVHWIWLIRDP